MILFRQMLSSSPYIFLLYVFEDNEVQACRRRRSKTMQILKDMSFPDMIYNHLRDDESSLTTSFEII